MKSHWLLLFTIVLIGFTPTSVNAEVLNSSEIKKTILGKRILLATRFGVEFPLVYNSNGTVKGDGTGTGLGDFFAPKETGKWWIKGNELCQKFPTWYNGNTQCFTLKKINGNQLKWKSKDGRSGTAKVG